MSARQHPSLSAARLYEAIVEAEKAARQAHDLSSGAPFWTRWSLGRAQSILMHYVVKHASEQGARERKGNATPPPGYEGVDHHRIKRRRHG